MILPYCFIICHFVCICFFYSVCIIMTTSRKYIYFVISVIVKGNKQEKFSCIKHNHLVISVPLYHHFPHLLHVPVRLEDVSIDVHAPSYLSNLRKPYSPSLTLRAMSCWILLAHLFLFSLKFILFVFITVTILVGRLWSCWIYGVSLW